MTENNCPHCKAEKVKPTSIYGDTFACGALLFHDKTTDRTFDCYEREIAMLKEKLEKELYENAKGRVQVVFLESKLTAAQAKSEARREIADELANRLKLWSLSSGEILCSEDAAVLAKWAQAMKEDA